MTEDEYDKRILESIIKARNPQLLYGPIHPWRWRILAVWCMVFTALVFWGQRQNREAINKVRQNSASVASLQRTNCGLRAFLLDARSARQLAARREKDPAARRADRQAVHAYTILVNAFTRDNCAR